MAGQRFAVRHVLIGLDPRRRRNLPAPLVHTALDLLKHIGRVALHDSVYRRLRLRKLEIRIFVHEVQHRAEGIDDDRRGLLIAPHPVHVYVRVGNAVYSVCFRRLRKVGKLRLRLLRRRRRQRGVGLYRRNELVRYRLDARVEFAAVQLRDAQHILQLVCDTLGPVIGTGRGAYGVKFLRCVHNKMPLNILELKLLLFLC